LAPAGFVQVEYGRSRNGHPLTAFIGGEGDALIVAVTRQHPPETTGAAAFRAFAERIAAEEPGAARFRASNRILLVPMANPDGVLKGHWRWNDGGVDLNRDWGDFTQPETGSLRDLILKESDGRRPTILLDFHSTRRSVVYAPPLDSGPSTIDLLPSLQPSIDRAVGNAIPWTYSHNATDYNLKRWAFDVLKAPGLTVELADDASNDTIESLGRALAEGLLRYRAPLAQ
jgi:predicted deacylase